MRTFYFSNKGKDTNSGDNPDKPWKSIQKIKNIRLEPGDEILLECGSVFQGAIEINSSGTANKPILIGAYGKGKDPILQGSQSVTNFTSWRDSIYVAENKNAVLELLSDDDWMQLARYPSEGYFRIDNGGKDHIIDRELLKNPIDCAGATVRIRPVNWQYQVATVKKHDYDTLHFNEVVMYNCNNSYGYYLDNKLEFLTEPGEWYYDKKTKKLYFKSPGEQHPEKQNVVAVIHEYGIILNKVSYVNISGIHIQKFFKGGVVGKSGTNNCSISDCTIEKIHQDGIYFEENCKLNTFLSNTVFDIKGRGIVTLDNFKAEIKNNHVFNVGLFPGYGYNGVNGGTAIAVLKTERAVSLNQQNIDVVRSEIPSEVVDKMMPIFEWLYPDENFLAADVAKFLSEEERKAYLKHFTKLMVDTLPPYKYESEQSYIGYNQVSNAGHTGIRFDGMNILCEYNLVKDTMLVLNDAGAIYTSGQDFEFSIGSTIRRNIVINTPGNVEATPFRHIYAPGIYIDNKCIGHTLEENIIVDSEIGILINDEAREMIIRNNTLFNNKINIIFSEYYRPGTLTDCELSGNISFCKEPHQRALFIESRISEQFSPLIKSDNNFFGSSYYTFPIIRLTYSTGRRIWDEYTLDAWKQHSKMDTYSSYWAPADPEARPRYSEILINYTHKEKTFAIDQSERDYYDLNNNALGDSIALKPFEAKIILTD